MYIMNVHRVSLHSLPASLSPHELYPKTHPLTPPGADENHMAHANSELDATALNPQPLPPRADTADAPETDPGASLRSIVIVGGHDWTHLAPPLPCPEPVVAFQQ
jgi:hypothetical protein